MSSNYCKVIKSSSDAESVTLEISDAYLNGSADIIVGGICYLAGVCVSSDVAANIGKSYFATIHFLYRNDTPFLLVDSALAYEYDGMTIAPAAMSDGGTKMGVTVTGTDFGTTNSNFIWTATYLLTYITNEIGE